ncbi:hypothetical protein F2Q68_00042059 [Brassica cretica]|uniref:Uncharacterized protein n=1 Tax=Brassica cretica TaxID=69181 RepID=A0A8S9MPR8_BRACR|nr:hypothetical protein F2Q68_00042059 [Brassica cretica]
MFVAHKTSRAFESVQDLREYLEVPVETIFLLPFVADMSWCGIAISQLTLSGIRTIISLLGYLARSAERWSFHCLRP